MAPTRSQWDAEATPQGDKHLFVSATTPRSLSTIRVESYSVFMYRSILAQKNAKINIKIEKSINLSLLVSDGRYSEIFFEFRGEIIAVVKAAGICNLANAPSGLVSQKIFGAAQSELI